MPNLNSYLRSRIGKVCVAITGATPAEMLERATAVVKETPFLEFRLDYLERYETAIPDALHEIKLFLRQHTEATAIATCRRTESGGRFDGTTTEQMKFLLDAASPGEDSAALQTPAFQIVDVELETAEALNVNGLDDLRAKGVGLIVSYHDYDGTGDLDAVYERIAPFKPEFVKVVTTANKLTDNVKMIRFVERISESASVIGLCMGEAGVISRVLGLRAGSVFTFAAAHAGEETGPGQIAARTLVETYRIEEVDPATKIYGVAGDPVSKSLSPIMLNTAFRRETVNAVYLALHANDVDELVALIQQIPIQGVSITMPHKQTILPFLEHMDPLSKKIGACNTVLRAQAGPGQPGKLYGFNTDVAGIIVPLEKRLTLRGAKVLVLGAGGSARAAAFGLKDKGADVYLLNRSVENAAKLAKQSGAKVIKREALPKASFDVILNATPVGMAGSDAEQLITAADFKAGLKTKLVFDLVYNPVDTPLIRLARQLAIPIITGVEMFVQQGARQFEIWTGKPAPEDEMLRVVVHALRQAAEPGSAPMPEIRSSAPSRQEPEAEEPDLDADEAVAEPEPVKAPAKVKAKKKAAPTAKKAKS